MSSRGKKRMLQASRNRTGRPPTHIRFNSVQEECFTGKQKRLHRRSEVGSALNPRKGHCPPPHYMLPGFGRRQVFSEQCLTPGGLMPAPPPVCLCIPLNWVIVVHGIGSALPSLGVHSGLVWCFLRTTNPVSASFEPVKPGEAVEMKRFTNSDAGMPPKAQHNKPREKKVGDRKGVSLPGWDTTTGAGA